MRNELDSLGVAFILIGLAAFPAGYLSDLGDLKGSSVLKAGGMAASLFLALAAHVGVVFGPGVAVPKPLLIAGMPILALSICLLYRSLWGELPVRESYSAGPPAEGRRRVVRTGTYALTRHPGLLWYGLFLLSLLALTGSLRLAAAAPLWWLADLLYILAQDRFIFPHIFEDYVDYRREVPKLWPTVRSISRCISSWNGPGWNERSDQPRNR